MRLQFVVGGYIEHEHNHINVGSSWNEPQMTYQTLGIPGAVPAGHRRGSGAADPRQHLQRRVDAYIDITEDERSGFADLTFAVTSKLKIEAGVPGGRLHPAVLPAVRRHCGFGSGRLLRQHQRHQPHGERGGRHRHPDRRHQHRRRPDREPGGHHHQHQRRPELERAVPGQLRGLPRRTWRTPAPPPPRRSTPRTAAPTSTRPTP
ncbi:MAG: hypothetical protein WDN45_06150 [Caulobacteraceae bacterium]